jgi:hypothetical protein
VHKEGKKEFTMLLGRRLRETYVAGSTELPEAIRCQLKHLRATEGEPASHDPDSVDQFTRSNLADRAKPRT